MLPGGLIDRAKEQLEDEVSCLVITSDTPCPSSFFFLGTIVCLVIMVCIRYVPPTLPVLVLMENNRSFRQYKPPVLDSSRHRTLQSELMKGTGALL